MSGRRSRNGVRWTLLIIVAVVGRAAAGSVATNPDPADGAAVWPLIGGTNVYTTLEFSPGAGAISHTGYFSDDYDDVAGRDPAHCLGAPPFPKISPTLFLIGFDDAGIPAFARAPLERGKTYYWAIDEFDGTRPHAGAVWSFTVMTEKTWNPDPADGAQDVIADPEVTLSWSRGDVDTTGYHVSYEVYYGTDSGAVEAATIPNATVLPQEYAIGDLGPGAEYFWRVDTVLTHSAPPFPSTTIKGDLWSFKTAGPRTITVDDDGPADFNKIQAAIDYSNHGDVIILNPGRYTGDGNRDIDYKGKAITVRSIDPNDPDIVAATVIDCNGSESYPHRGFYFHTDEDEASVLDGLLITGGFVKWHTEYEEGGGICVSDSSPAIANCIIMNNRGGVNSRSDGGGMCIRNGSPTLTNCQFIGNYCGGHGGGLFNYNSSPTLINCSFTGNTVDGDTWGAGVANLFSEPVLRNCRFVRNRALFAVAGGMYNLNSSPIVIDCTFIENYSYPEGGGIYNYSSQTTVTNSIFIRNSAGQGQSGGGIYGFNSGLVLTNCTFFANSTTFGSALACNTDQGPTSTIQATNCIFWDGGDEVESDEHSTVTITYSDIQGGWAGNGNIDEDPCFVEPGHWDPNGTPDDVNDDFWVDGDYHLRADSPCIDAGDPDFVAGPNDVDMDGEKRVMLGRVDMGADEFNPVVAEFVVVRRERVERSVFEYECEVVLENVSTFALENIRLQMARWSENMTTIEPNVTFGDAEIRPGESARSLDTCTFTVDRSAPIDPAEIIWHSTAEMADTGATMEHTLSSLLSVGLADSSNFDDLTDLAEKWLWQGSAGGIDEDSVQDGTVNLADFAKFAEQWKTHP